MGHMSSSMISKKLSAHRCKNANEKHQLKPVIVQTVQQQLVLKDTMNQCPDTYQDNKNERFIHEISIDWFSNSFIWS